jgi:trigger factor
MNIVKQNVDELNALLNVKVSKEDYEEKVNKTLKDYQKKANIKGFRPGKTPMSYITKMYRIPVLVEEINKLVSDNINEYLKKENIQILGDPMPSEKQSKPISWEQDSSFEFNFELGLAPTINIKVSEKDKLDYYRITIDEKMIGASVDNYKRRYGKYVDTDIITENELLKADIVELKEGGIFSNDVTVSMEYIKDDETKKMFVGKKAGDKITVDIRKAFPNDYELSNVLKIKKEELAGLSNEFDMTIKSISKFEQAELNQQLFDLIFGEGQVTGEEQFRQKITDDLKGTLEQESDYKLFIDARKYYLDKTKAAFPKDFLVRWLMSSNDGKITSEQLDKEYPAFEENLKWQLLKNHIVKEAEIKINDDDVKAKAKELARRQFRQYGIFNITDEYLEEYSSQMLKKQEDVKHIIDNVLDDKIFAYIKSKVKLNEKNVTSEEFNKMFETNK